MTVVILPGVNLDPETWDAEKEKLLQTLNVDDPSKRDMIRRLLDSGRKHVLIEQYKTAIDVVTDGGTKV